MSDFKKVYNSTSAAILDEANQLIHGDRKESYGSAEESFARIGMLWGNYLGVHISRHDVAMLMVLLKVSRATTDHKKDTYVDICGYAALAGRLAEFEDGEL